MSDHIRFDEEHLKVCADCRDAYADFIDEETDTERLDNLIEE